MPRQAFLVAITLFGVAAAGSGTQRSTSPSEDVVTELRALRRDIQENTTATIRAQLLVGRLQLQESRTKDVAWQLAEARRVAAEHQAQKAKPLATLKAAEEAIARGLQGFDHVIANARADLARLEQEEQRLQAQERQLADQLKKEQQRWSEFNSELDQLERSLVNRARRP